MLQFLQSIGLESNQLPSGPFGNASLQSSRTRIAERTFLPDALPLSFQSKEKTRYGTGS